jgi:nucleotide-binding universal stress UspA family protein
VTTTVETTHRAEQELPLHRRVLVALHGSLAPHGAIRVARLIARALDAPLHGVLVWPTRLAPSEIPRLLRLDPETLEGMVLDVEVGDPAERLGALARAEPVAFVVVPAESGGGDACGLGETAARTLTEASTGVIVVRPGASVGRLRRILVPLDGAPSTAAALEPVGELARRMGASLDVVMIQDAAAPPLIEEGAMAPPQYIDQPQHEWAAFSEEFVQRFLGAIGHCPAVETRFFLGAGAPGPEILRFAEALGSDLITLVWHGGCDPHGAVFREVMRGSSRPVLVLRR